MKKEKSFRIKRRHVELKKLGKKIKWLIIEKTIYFVLRKVAYFILSFFN